MGKPKKYGTPLYCVCWPPGQHPLVAGGGGKKSSGIANRLVALQLSGEELDDEPASQLVTDDAAVRMVLGMAGTRLIIVLGRGGLQAFDLLRADGQAPKLLPFSGELATQLRQFGLVKCIAFGNITNQLAVGGEDRSLKLVEWPSLRTKWDLRNEFGLKDALRDIDFSPGHKDKVLVTTCEDGTCTLWQTDTGMRITSLSLPADLPRGASFNRAKFSRGSGLHLFTSVNAGGDGYVLRWEQDAHGIVVLTKQAKAHNSPITAFDISATGRFLGTGTSEGDIAILSAAKLTPLRRVRQAHMVFVTALTFAPDESALLTVSADASARATLVSTASRLPLQRPRSRVLLLVWTVLVLLLAFVLQRYFPQSLSFLSRKRSA